MKDVQAEAVEILRFVQHSLHVKLGMGRYQLENLEQQINEDISLGIWPEVVSAMERHNFKINTLPQVTTFGNGSLEFQPAFLDRYAQDKGIRVDIENDQAKVSDYRIPHFDHGYLGWQAVSGGSALSPSTVVQSGVH